MFQNKSEQLTVIIPAYNEEQCIGDTIESMQRQTTPPKHIMVVDDCSTDNTANVARSYGVSVICPKSNTGTKAGAQNIAVDKVKTKYVMAVDADTTLAEDAIEKIMQSFKGKNVAASCGFVIPRFRKTFWERGRYVEYLFAFSFYKQIQDYFDKPLISSGCFSAYDTNILKKHGGWKTRTMAEDMDQTWTYYKNKYEVRFVPEALCFPIEPHNFDFLRKQLKRWSHGFVQNLKIHWRDLLHVPYLRSILAVAIWDSLIAATVFLFLIPLLAIIYNPLFLLSYVLDIPLILVPVIVEARKRGEIVKALVSFPAFLALRMVNSFFVLKAFFVELILRKSFLTYDKGH